MIVDFFDYFRKILSTYILFRLCFTKEMDIYLRGLIYFWIMMHCMFYKRVKSRAKSRAKSRIQ